MTQHQATHRSPRAATATTLLAASLLWAAQALAGPGAHGPGGEHLDAHPLVFARVAQLLRKVVPRHAR